MVISRPLIYPMILLVTAGYLISDLLIPRKFDLRDFDAAVVGRIESDMWRAYYDEDNWLLFTKLAYLLRKQAGAPFFRSHLMAYYAASAARTFQIGQTRDDYLNAIPSLTTYFEQLKLLTRQSFQEDQVASLELEWWIERREVATIPGSWQKILSSVQAEIYQLPKARFDHYATLKIQAMQIRDQKKNKMTPADWRAIEDLLIASWRALHFQVNLKSR